MPHAAQTILTSLPSPGERRIAIHVTPTAERMLRSGHPWLYEQAIRAQSHAGQPGDLAVIYDRRERFVAVGFYDPSSPIRVRLLQSRTPRPIDRSWFIQRMSDAVQLRARLIRRPDTTGYRLIHGENDGLPGLVVDRYAQTLVVKLYTSAWVAHLREAVEALRSVVSAERIILRLSRAVQRGHQHLHGLRDGMTLVGRVLQGPVLFQEHGLRFEADVLRGNKTGFFLDQRDNRAEVERLSRGHRALDVFASTGACSVHAARGGAREVTSVEISQPAREAAARNMALNRTFPSVRKAAHRVIAGDGFEVLALLAKGAERFSLIILDPPSFAKTKEQVKAALAAYRRLTRLALGVLEPGGFLMVSCCSGQVSEELFFKTMHNAAAQAGRPLHELARTGHPLDHPVSFKEGTYLKCLFAVAP